MRTSRPTSSVPALHVKQIHYIFVEDMLRAILLAMGIFACL